MKTYVILATVLFSFYVVALNVRERCSNGSAYWCAVYQGMGGKVYQ